jgi:hypothetical protein
MRSSEDVVAGRSPAVVLGASQTGFSSINCPWRRSGQTARV